ASDARIQCKSCAFRYAKQAGMFRTGLNKTVEAILKTLIAKREDVVAEIQPSLRWALASLCLSMLMPSLDTSIANTSLPTLATAYTASFQAVQWVVLAYLLA